MFFFSFSLFPKQQTVRQQLQYSYCINYYKSCINGLRCVPSMVYHLYVAQDSYECDSTHNSKLPYNIKRYF